MLPRDLMGEPSERLRAEILAELGHPSRSLADVAEAFGVTQAYVARVWDIADYVETDDENQDS
jgi:hypothetical protein